MAEAEIVIIDLVSSAVLGVPVWVWIALTIVVWQATRNDARWRRIGLVVLIFGWVMQTRPFAEALIAPLEKAYPAPSIQSLQQRNVADVVVLTGGGFPDDGELLSNSFPHATMYRMIGGMELCRKIGPQCRLTFSGSSGTIDTLPIADVMERFAREFTPGLSVQSEFQSNSTAEHPLNVKRLIGQAPFVLVTSAYHMPRAMLVFQRAGLQPIPYPVDRYVFGDYKLVDILPSTGNLEAIPLALHEYVGLLWYSIAVSH